MNCRRLIPVITLLVFSGFSYAQSKVGSVNLDIIVWKMTDAGKIHAEAQKFASELDLTKQLNQKSSLYKEKKDEYHAVARSGLLTDAQIQERLSEIRLLQKEQQQLHKKINYLTTEKKSELKALALKNIHQAIDSVAKREGYSMVVNYDGKFNADGTIVYAEKNHDLTSAVARELGISL